MTDLSIAAAGATAPRRTRSRFERATGWAKGAWFPLALLLLLALALRIPGFERPTHIGFVSYYIDEPKILSNVTQVIRGDALLAHWPYALYYWLTPQILLLYTAYIPSILPYASSVFLASSVRQVIGLHGDAFLYLVRLNMLLFSLGLVAMMFAYGRRCAGRWGGIAAAAVVAVIPVVVNHSRWAYYDLPMTFWYWLCVGLLAMAWRQASLRGIYVCAALAAWTVTTKQNGAPIALLWFATMLAVVARSQALPWYGVWRSRHFWLSGLLAVAVGLACYPTLLDPDSVRRFAYTADAVYVEGDERLQSRLWVTLATNFWPLQGPSWLLALLAIGFVPLLAFSRDRYLAAMCVAGGVAYYAIVGYSTQGNDRLLLPFAPALALGLAGWVALIRRFVTPSWARGALAASLVAAATAPLLYNTTKFNLLLTAADTRIQSRDWLLANLPAGAKVAIEAHVARLPSLNLSSFGRDYAMGRHLPGYDVAQLSTVALAPLSAYRERGYDAIVRTDGMLALVWRYARQGHQYYTADEDRESMGKGAFFDRIPLATIIETYASQRLETGSAIIFAPSPIPGRKVNLFEARAQFLYHWQRPLLELWREHDQIVLGPEVSVLLLR